MKQPSILQCYRILRAYHRWTIFQAFDMPSGWRARWFSDYFIEVYAHRSRDYFAVRPLEPLGWTSVAMEGPTLRIWVSNTQSSNKVKYRIRSTLAN